MNCSTRSAGFYQPTGKCKLCEKPLKDGGLFCPKCRPSPLTAYQRDHLREDHRIATARWSRIASHENPEILQDKHRHRISCDLAEKGFEFCCWFFLQVEDSDFCEDLRRRTWAIMNEGNAA